MFSCKSKGLREKWGNAMTSEIMVDTGADATLIWNSSWLSGILCCK